MNGLPERLRLTTSLQPVVSAHTGATIGFEALLRPFRGRTPVPPAPLFAQEAHPALIRRLDVAARRLAVVESSRILDSEQLLFVNLSPATLSGHWAWLERLAAVVLANGLRPEQVVLELTEQIRPDLRLLAALRSQATDAGIRLALDDLGEGHATFAALDALRPEFVKLAPWAARLSVDANLGEVLRAVVEDCHTRGAAVVAEGVETEQQRAALHGLGVDHLQGFLIGRPVASRQLAQQPDRQPVASLVG